MIARTHRNETAKDAAFRISAHCTPKVNSSGAASGGPMTWAIAADAESWPLAAGCSSSGTIAPMTASRDGTKNWSKLEQATITAYRIVSCAPTGRSCRSAGSTSRLATRTQRAASDTSMILRRFHRSTNTPAMGPTTTAGTAAAISAPLAAAGAHGSPLAMTVAVHSSAVT